MTEENPLAELANEPTEQVLGEETTEVVEEVEVSQEQEAAVKQAKRERTQNRIKDLNTKYREEERQNKANQKIIAELREAARIKERPNPDNYIDDDKFEADNKTYSEQELNDRVDTRIGEIQAENRRTEASKQINKQTEVYVENRRKAVEADAKYVEHEKLVDGMNQQAPEIFSAILKGGGPAMVQYLGENPEELEDIVYMNPADRLYELGKIAAKVKAKSPKKTSTAPAPTTSERGGARSVSIKKTAGHDPKKESWKAYCQRRNGIK